MDEDKTKGRTWNGYVCPGCRTVFRVAADFGGTEVMCPSCNGTLRLPKAPEEVLPHMVHPDNESVEAAKPTKATKPARMPEVKHKLREPSSLKSMLATSDGRLKLTLALLVPLALLVGAVVIFPSKIYHTENARQITVPPLQAPRQVVEKPAPPPPPVAVNEMPVPDEESALPEIAVAEPVSENDLPKPVEPAPEALPDAPSPETAVMPAPMPEPPPALAGEEDLVEAIPAVPQTAPEIPAPAPATQPEPQPEVVPEPVPTAQHVHTVASGDTLTTLSSRYKVGVATIKEANGMKSDIIFLGQKLVIPGGIAPPDKPAAATIEITPTPSQAAASHTVVRGDTLARIARKYGVSAQRIMQANNMKNDVVRLGRKLVIPPANP